MSAELLPSIVANLDESSRGRTAGDVLADVAWDDERSPPDPKRLTAAQFLGRMVEEDDGSREPRG